MMKQLFIISLLSFFSCFSFAKSGFYFKNYEGLNRKNTINYTLLGDTNIITNRKTKFPFNKNGFNVGFSTINTFEVRSNGFSTKFSENYFHINVGYKLLVNKRFTPDVGLGFIYNYNKDRYGITFNGSLPTASLYRVNQDYIPYIKVGLSLEPKKCLGVMANIAVFQSLSSVGTGFIGKIGLKCAISPKIALSLCPEIIIYNGMFSGPSFKYTKNTYTNEIIITERSKENTKYRKNGGITSVNFNIHF